MNTETYPCRGFFYSVNSHPGTSSRTNKSNNIPSLSQNELITKTSVICHFLAQNPLPVWVVENDRCRWRMHFICHMSSDIPYARLLLWPFHDIILFLLYLSYICTYKRTNPFPVVHSSFPFIYLSRILKAIIRLAAVECKVNSWITCIEQLLNAKQTAVEQILVLMKAINTLHESS